jgi:hypothetical protein
VGERFVHTEEVTGSNPVSPTPNRWSGSFREASGPSAFPHAPAVGPPFFVRADRSGLVSAWLTEWGRRGPTREKAGFVRDAGLHDLDAGAFALRPGGLRNLSLVRGEKP